jgi:hypothetical protein
MLYAKPWEHPSAVAILSIGILLSDRTNSSPAAAHLLLSQSQQSDLVGHRLRLSKVLERISQRSSEPLYATITSHRKEGIFLYEYPKKKKEGTRERCSSVVHSSSTVAILTTETSF